jgi:hypothetical protein
MTEYDSPWKEFLDHYLKAFLEFSFLELHDEIDWSYEVVMRDKELQQIAPESESGSRIVDKLAEVKMFAGDIQWLLIHVEVQSQKTESFAKRMYTCFYRIKDKYDKPLVSLAILGDDNPNWRPSSYSQEVYGCNVVFTFPTVKLLDYLKDIEALESSRNPFAMIALTHLMTMQTTNEPDNRYRWKYRLMRLLYQRGYRAEEIKQLLRVIDWMMDLPSGLEIQFRKDMESIEREKNMDYVTSFERLAKAEGIELGLEKGREEGLEQGVERGLVAGKIQLLQTMLGVTESRLEDLIQTPKEALVKTLAELNSRMKLKLEASKES